VSDQRALQDAGAIVTNLRDPSDPAIRTALCHDVDLDHSPLSLHRSRSGYRAVRALIDRRLIAIVGRRVAPRRDHVIVVGLGQVGLRLCLLLRALGTPVLAIESNGDADYVARARDHGGPVVIGRGGSAHLLERVRTGRARALAAVTSDEIENIAIVVAALGCREDLRTLLRAGRGEVTNETRSLLKLGVVRDVYRIGGTLPAVIALGSQANEAFLHERTVFLVSPDGHVEPFEPIQAAA